MTVKILSVQFNNEQFSLHKQILIKDGSPMRELSKNLNYLQLKY